MTGLRDLAVGQRDRQPRAGGRRRLAHLGRQVQGGGQVGPEPAVPVAVGGVEVAGRVALAAVADPAAAVGGELRRRAASARPGRSRPTRCCRSRRPCRRPRRPHRRGRRGSTCRTRRRCPGESRCRTSRRSARRRPWGRSSTWSSSAPRVTSKPRSVPSCASLAAIDSAVPRFEPNSTDSGVPCRATMRCGRRSPAPSTRAGGGGRLRRGPVDQDARGGGGRGCGSRRA